MRKILFGLFIAISYMANAALPVVNDSVLVEADEDRGYLRWLLSDSLNGVPISFSMHYQEKIDELEISVYEIEDILSREKMQDFMLRIRGSYVSCTYKELKVIKDALQKIFEYSQTPLIEDLQEELFYKKELRNGGSVVVDLDYVRKDNTWDCFIEIYNRKGDYWGVKLNSGAKDLPLIVEAMKKVLFKYNQREQTYKEPLFKKECKKGYNQYYFDYGDSLVLKLVAKENVNKDYSKELFAQKSNQNINNLLNEIIKNEYKDFDELSVYGMLDLVIDEQGDVARAKLILSNRLSEKLSDNTIGLMLKKINNYKFLPISNKDTLNEVEYVNVHIPLAVKNKRIIEFIERGVIILSNTYKEPNLVSSDKGGGTQYFMDYGYGLDERYRYVLPNENYLNKLVEERYIIDFNYKVNGVIDDKYKDLKGMYNYGTVEVVVDENGWVVYSKLILKKNVSDELDEKTITRVLANIEDYKFKEIKEQDFPGVDYVKVFIPLNGYPVY